MMIQHLIADLSDANGAVSQSTMPAGSQQCLPAAVLGHSLGSGKTLIFSVLQDAVILPFYAAWDTIHFESSFPCQSTDRKVNEIVPPLYAIAPDAKAMADLDVSAPGPSCLHVQQQTAMASVKTSRIRYL